MCRGSCGRTSKDPAARGPATQCSTPHPSHRGACSSLMSGVGEKRKEEGHIGNAVSGSGSVVEVSKRQRRMTVRFSQSVGSRTTLTMVGKARVRRGRRLRDEPNGGDTFRSQGRCVGLRLASRRDNATRGLTTHGDAILISVIFSLASYTRRLTRRDANGENSEMLPEASNSSSDIDLHIRRKLKFF